MAQAAAGTGLIQKVDGLVGQKTVCNIPFRQLHTGAHNGLRHLHMMVCLIIALHAAQHVHGVVQRGFFHLYRLEAALQRLVFFDIFAVFGKRGGANHLNLAARKGRLQNIGGVHGALRIARTGDVMNFINE